MHDEMAKVIVELSRACVEAEDISQAYARAPSPPLPLVTRGVGPLKPRVPRHGSDATECGERAASLWLVLRQLLRWGRSEVVLSLFVISRLDVRFR